MKRIINSITASGVQGAVLVRSPGIVDPCLKE